MRSVVQNIYAWLFPAFCATCGVEGHWWCQQAGARLPWPRCASCRADYHTEKRTGCAEALPIWFVGWYEEPRLRSLLHQWKYESYWAVSSDWASYLAANLGDVSFDALVPVPLHWTRSLARGFNQSGMLANDIGAHLQKPVVSLVEKTRKTPPQAQIEPEKRGNNLANCFRVIAPGNGRRVLVVDDVVTTGTTIREVIKTLTAAGWNVVGIVTVALAGSHGSV